MIKVTVRNNNDSKTFMTEGTMTVREAMNESGFAFSPNTTMHLNGEPVSEDKLDRSINSFGAFENVFLQAITNGKNA